MRLIENEWIHNNEWSKATQKNERYAHKTKGSPMNWDGLQQNTTTMDFKIWKKKNTRQLDYNK